MQKKILVTVFSVLLFLSTGCSTDIIADDPSEPPAIVSEADSLETSSPDEETLPPITEDESEASAEPSPLPVETVADDTLDDESNALVSNDIEEISDSTPEDNAEPQETVTTKDFVLNTNTMKFHYPTCNSVDDIKPENRADVNDTAENIESQGYAPCKRCNPQ